MTRATWAAPGWAVLRGIVPLRRSQVAGDLLAGVTLAALSMPQALGYAKIAGMPVVTGLYTLILPMAVFAVLGSSRHLVVAADSATAAILATALANLAVPGSARYVSLAGLAALLTGGLLLLARLARLGFVADFLSRTVLVGFLTGVGIRVAAQQLPDMLGVTRSGPVTLGRVASSLARLPQAHPGAVAVSVAVILISLAARRLTHRIPGPLIAVVGAIIVSRAADLAHRGVPVIGTVPAALPSLRVPVFSPHDVTSLLGAAASMFVVILAQSTGTARAFAAKHREPFHADTDLVGLGAANVAAGFSGTFVVNGSPTQTQVADSAGARSQLAQLTTSAVVVLTLLVASGPLADLPTAALAAVVFLIGIQLINVRSLRRIRAVRKNEFAIALLAAAAVVVLGVQDGIVLAVIASIIDHLRHTYHPRNSVLMKSPAGHWQAIPVQPGAQTEPGLVVYRFGNDLYYANADRLHEDLVAITGHGSALRWLVLDSTAIGDVDYTAAAVLTEAIREVQEQGMRFIFAGVIGPVHRQLDRYGVTAAVGPGAFYDTPGAALEAFHAAAGSRR